MIVNILLLFYTKHGVFNRFDLMFYFVKKVLTVMININKTNNLRTEHKIKTRKYEIGNPGSGLGQAHKCGGLHLLLWL